VGSHYDPTDPQLNALAYLAVAVAVSFAIMAVARPEGGGRIFRGARGKVTLREHLGLRLWPLAATLAFGCFVFFAADLAKDPRVFQNYGHLTLRSFVLAARACKRSADPPRSTDTLSHGGGGHPDLVVAIGHGLIPAGGWSRKTQVHVVI